MGTRLYLAPLLQLCLPCACTEWCLGQLSVLLSPVPSSSHGSPCLPTRQR